MNQGIFRATKGEMGNSIEDFIKASDHLKNKMPKSIPIGQY